MSRLADAESKLAAAFDALETAIARDGAADGKAAEAGNGTIDIAMIMTEIGRIDEQLAHAMELIADIRRGAASEGGNA